MKKKDYKLEDYKVKMYGKPVSGKSYSEENAMLFEDKKEEQGKDMKKHKNLTCNECIVRHSIFLLLMLLISEVGAIIGVSFIQYGVVIFIVPMLYYYVLFLKKIDD